MPPPTPETALLNKLFETHHNPPPPVTPLTSDDKYALESFQFGLQQALEAHTSSASSTPSTSTLALEDDEVRNIFTSDKNDVDSVGGDDLRTPRPSVNDTNGCNQPTIPIVAPNSRMSADELNPNAKPFVPSFLPDSASPVATPTLALTSNPRRLLRPVSGDTLPTLIPRWLCTFRRALDTTANTTPDYDVLSMVIVNSEPWSSSEAMTELAQEFVWRGTEDISPEQVGVVARFAQEVYKKFQNMRGEDYGKSFLWHIKEVVLGTYVSVWDANNNPKAISYQWIPSPAYLRAAIALGSFIGELFTRDIITSANITACLNMVMQNLVAFEHVEAIQAIVVHAGPTYWFFNGDGSEGIRRFESVLMWLTDRLHNEMSVVRRTIGPGELKKAVGSIMMRCDIWMEQLQIALRKSQHSQLCATSIAPNNHDPVL